MGEWGGGGGEEEGEGSVIAGYRYEKIGARMPLKTEIASNYLFSFSGKQFNLTSDQISWQKTIRPPSLPPSLPLSLPQHKPLTKR